jgi:hypothetical protein
VYPGCLCSYNASGYLVDGTNTASTRCAGIADGGGTATSNGEFEVEVFTTGVVKLKNSTTQPVTQAYVGKHCYIEDNETVAITTSQKIRAGLVEAVDSDGVRVNIREEAFREGTDLETGGDDEIDMTGILPGAHASSHENGNADEISVAGLSGELADAQPPKTHATAHQAGGADVLNKPVPAATHELAAPFTSAGGAAWEDVDSVAVTLVADGAVFATVHFDLEAAAATAVAPNFRVVIGASNGPTIAVDLLSTQDALAAACSHMAAGLSAGAITCKLQVQDDGVTAVTVSHAVITAIGLQV